MTELSDRSWRAFSRRFSSALILVVASEVIGAERVRRERDVRPHYPDATHAGWLRNRAAFERPWRRTHHAIPLRVGDLHGWDLRPRQPGYAAANASRTASATVATSASVSPGDDGR